MATVEDTAKESKVWANISEVKRANKAANYHFFDKETMRFFESKIESKILHGSYFITSEKKNLTDDKRSFSVRKVKPNGAVESVGTFTKYETYDEAVAGLDAHLTPDVTV